MTQGRTKRIEEIDRIDRIFQDLHVLFEIVREKGEELDRINRILQDSHVPFLKKLKIDKMDIRAERLTQTRLPGFTCQS